MKMTDSLFEYSARSLIEVHHCFRGWNSPFIRVMSKPQCEIGMGYGNWLDKAEPWLDPRGKGENKGSQGSIWRRGRPQPFQKGRRSIDWTWKEERKGTKRKITRSKGMIKEGISEGVWKLERREV